MIRRPLFALTIAALVSLPACSEKTDQTAQNAADSAGHDIRAAADRAGDAIDRAARQVSGKAEKAGKRLEAATDRAGDDIENGTDRAKEKTGAALENAGKSLQH